MIVKISHLLLIGFLSFVFVTCQEYTGYDYSAEATTESARIHGTVTNKFTGEAVDSARIDLEGQSTLTDGSGNYMVYYVLGTDEQRGKKVGIRIMAKNYHPYQDSLELYPTDTPLDIDMEYGAPIIKKLTLIYHEEGGVQPGGGQNEEGLYFCQAEIIDYQGRDNIKTVQARFQFQKPFSLGSYYLPRSMNFKGTASDYSYFYQTSFIPSLAGGWVFGYKQDYEITVTDHDGFSDKIFTKYYASSADTFLFDPF